MSGFLRPWIRFAAIVLLLAGMGTHAAAMLSVSASLGAAVSSTPPPGHEAVVSESSLPRTVLRQEKDPPAPPPALLLIVEHDAANAHGRRGYERPSSAAFRRLSVRVLPPPIGPPHP